jgi:hypothetical protein
MSKRITIAAAVGVITFLTLYIELNLIYTHGPHHNAMLHFAAPVYAVLFGAISAAVTFGVSLALAKS